MKGSVRLLVFASLFFTALLPAAPMGPEASPAQPSAFRERLQPLVNDRTIAGAVALVANRDRILGVEAVGYADLSKGAELRVDDLFWIASMTKPIAAAAVLMLQDEGKLNVTDPVENHLPEFKDLWLLQQEDSKERKLVRPERPITIRDLMTHTSGMGDPAPPSPHSTLAEAVMFYSQQPLRFQPGSRWQYSTAGIDVLGRIVEVVSGKACADFYTDRIFVPLGMKNTTFWPNARQAAHVAKSYKPGQSSGLEETDIFLVKGSLSDRRRTPRPGGGLFSTAHDVARFYQMMLNGGTLAGKRILSSESVAELTRTQTGDIRTGFTPGMSWGPGFQVVKEPQGVTAMLSPGTFGHGGAYGTQSWADPKRDLIYVLMIQRAGFANGDESPVRKIFQEAVAAGCH